MEKEGRQSALAADLLACWSKQKHTPDWPTPIESWPPGHAGEISSASWVPGIPENWTESCWHQSSKWYGITAVAVPSCWAFSNRQIPHYLMVWCEAWLSHRVKLSRARLSRRCFWLSVRPRFWLHSFCLFEKPFSSLSLCRCAAGLWWESWRVRSQVCLNGVMRCSRSRCGSLGR